MIFISYNLKLTLGQEYFERRFFYAAISPEVSLQCLIFLFLPWSIMTRKDFSLIWNVKETSVILVTMNWEALRIIECLKSVLRSRYKAIFFSRYLEGSASCEKGKNYLKPENQLLKLLKSTELQKLFPLKNEVLVL